MGAGGEFGRGLPAAHRLVPAAPSLNLPLDPGPCGSPTGPAAHRLAPAAHRLALSITADKVVQALKDSAVQLLDLLQRHNNSLETVEQAWAFPEATRLDQLIEKKC